MEGGGGTRMSAYRPECSRLKNEIRFVTIYDTVEVENDLLRHAVVKFKLKSLQEPLIPGILRRKFGLHSGAAEDR